MFDIPTCFHSAGFHGQQVYGWSMIAFPIPVPEGTSPIIGVLFGIAAIVGFVVLIWQAVRYFRSEREDRDSGGDADDR
jgi:hypothetical protein